MAHLIEFPTAGQGIVVVEVENPPEGRLVRSAKPGELAERAEETIEQAIGRVQPAIDAVLSLVARAAPREAEVEFAVKLSGQLGAVLASTSGEASFRVLLRWAPPAS